MPLPAYPAQVPSQRTCAGWERQPPVEATAAHFFQVGPVNLALELLHVDIETIQVQRSADIHETEHVHLAGIKLCLIIDRRLAQVIIVRPD
jgi:hypothetical protein